jgi:hypothetical protein
MIASAAFSISEITSESLIFPNYADQLSDIFLQIIGSKQQLVNKIDFVDNVTISIYYKNLVIVGKIVYEIRWERRVCT